MKLLALCALLCAMVALSSAEAAAEPEPENAKSGEVDVDKRTCWWRRPCRPKIVHRWRRPCRPKIVHRWRRPCRPKIVHRWRRPCWPKIVHRWRRPCRPKIVHRWRRPCWPKIVHRWKRPCWPKIVHRWRRPCRPKIVHRWKRPCWTKIGCRYFFYVRKPLTWHQAERNCRRLGGHLASVHSRRQYLKIRALIKKSSRGSPVTWIGGTDRCREGHWRWSDGSRLNYKNWCCGEPNNAGNQDCLQMNFSRRKCWDDAQCWLKRPSVCVRNRRR
ncbi:uncharacterized protein [Labrus bergylta]|uniref:uncharacterized protein n=1 Tax=Labrus bergylta TaxID=56723 RepID=UPI003313A37E